MVGGLFVLVWLMSFVGWCCWLVWLGGVVNEAGWCGQLVGGCLF